MGQLLSEEVAKKPIHVIIGSVSDEQIGQLVARRLHEFLGRWIPVHVFSCHRNPELVPIFAQEFGGQVLICIGGKSFQLPAVLDSWFLHLGKHVVIIGIPVGDTSEKRAPAVSAMRDLPAPCLVHWFPDCSEASVALVVELAVEYIEGKSTPNGESAEEWQQRVTSQRSSMPRIASE